MLSNQWLVVSKQSRCDVKSSLSSLVFRLSSVTLFLASVAFAAPKSASAYYGDAAFQYIENRLPTAEITCNEGLQYYPNDQKLQMLLDRIHEAKDEQKNENKKNDPKNDQNNQDQNNQDQNQDQDKQNQDQNKDQQNQDQQNQDQNGGQSSSSAQNDQNQDQQNQGDQGKSSDNQQQSSDSNGGAGEQPQQPEAGSSDSEGSDQEQEQPLAPGELTPEEAAQLLKDFDEQNGERKPWKPVRGQVRPAKDW